MYTLVSNFDSDARLPVRSPTWRLEFLEDLSLFTVIRSGYFFPLSPSLTRVTGRPDNGYLAAETENDP